MSNQVPAIKVLLLPKDTNALGTIFGGVILSHIDLASAVEARKTATAPLRDQGDERRGVPRAGFRGRSGEFLHRDDARGTNVDHREGRRRRRALGRRPGRARQGDRGGSGARGDWARRRRRCRFAPAPNDCRLRARIGVKRRLRLRRAGFCARRTRRRRDRRAAGRIRSFDHRDSRRRWPAVDGSAEEHGVGGGAGAAAAARDHSAASR